MKYDKDNEMFQMAIHLVNQTNRNIFLTGKAGTGKTTFLKYIRENGAKKMVVVAPTGVAAINAAGVTIHSFFQLPLSPFIPESRGLGFSNQQVESTNKHSLISTLRFNAERKKIFMELELLIIDEISMVRADTIDAIDTVLRHVRRRPSELFGGVQVLFIGDMLQLPPVTRDQEWNLLSEFYQGPYFFDSRALQENPPLYIEFNKIYRQSDERFIHVLNQVRNNQLDEDGLRLLESRYIAGQDITDHDGYIILTTHNNKAAEINARELQKLNTKAYTYESETKGEFGERAFPAERSLQLKVGAQVMFIRNDSAEKGKRYFNGKIGTVTSLEKDKILVQCDEGNQEIDVKPDTWENVSYSLDQQTRQLATNVLGSFTQFPLRLAWAITIHKSQGLTFDKAIIDAGEAFAPGQVYVALSRCTNLDGMILQSRLRSSGLMIDRRIAAFSENAVQGSRLQEELKIARRQYESEILLELFTFQSLLDDANELVLSIGTNRTSFSEGSLPWAEGLASELAIVESTGLKFRNQLTGLLSMNDQSPPAPAVLERLKAAATYFSASCSTIITTISKPAVSTDNKQFAKETNDALREIFTRLAQKKHLMSSVMKTFDITSYQESQSQFRTPSFSINVYGGASDTRALSRHPVLYKQLKQVRDSIANRKNIPIYRVIGSSSIEEMAQYLPQTLEELRQVSGFGEARIKQFGQQFLDIILKYSREMDLPSMVREPKIKKTPKPKAENKKVGQTRDETFQLFTSGKSIAEIASIRKLTISTIESHLSRFITDGMLTVEDVVSPDKIAIITTAIEKTGGGSLTSIREITGDAVTFGEIRLVSHRLLSKSSSTFG